MGTTKWLVALAIWLVPYILLLVVFFNLPGAWQHFLQATGFSDFPVLDRLPWLSWSTGVTISLGFAVGCCLMVHPRTRTIKRVVVALSCGMLILTWFIFFFTYTVTCLNGSSAASLASQVDAVASYNQGVCVAWCRSSDPEFPTKELLASGACPAGGDPIYETMKGTLDTMEKLWCYQALDHGVVNGTRPFDGSTPFEKLMNAGCGGAWVPLAWDTILSIALVCADMFSWVPLLTLIHISTSTASPSASHFYLNRT